MTGRIIFCGMVAAFSALSVPGVAADPAGSPRETAALARWQAAVAKNTAVRLLEEVFILDVALDQWATETNQRIGAMPTPQQLAGYTKKSPRLTAELSAGRLNDALGNPMTLRGVGKTPLMSKATVAQFASVVQPDFWKPFYEGPELSTAPPPEPAPANPVTREELRLTAVRLLEELRMIDSAIDQWAIEHNKPDGVQPRPQDFVPYIRKGSRIHGEIVAGRVNDSLGNPIVILPLGQSPTVSEATASKLAPVLPADFWGPFARK